MTPAERQRNYRARKGATTGQHGPTPTQPCGTIAAYKRHQRHNEPTCQPCKDAWAKYHRNRTR